MPMSFIAGEIFTCELVLMFMFFSWHSLIPELYNKLKAEGYTFVSDEIVSYSWLQSYVLFDHSCIHMQLINVKLCDTIQQVNLTSDHDIKFTYNCSSYVYNSINL